MGRKSLHRSVEAAGETANELAQAAVATAQKRPIGRVGVAALGAAALAGIVVVSARARKR